VLGAIFLDPEAIVKCSAMLTSDDFYRNNHQKIYASMLHLNANSNPVDVITVSQLLKQREQLDEIGGIGYLTNLANFVPTAANVEYYANIVEKSAVMRRLIRTATQIVSKGFAANEDVTDILDEAERKILEVSQRRSSGGFIPIKEALLDVFHRIDFLSKQKGSITGIPSGFQDLDRMTSGFQKSDLIIVAARPSVGKTAFALNIAQNVGVRANQSVAIFSLEMSASQLVQRIICAEGNIDASKIRSGRLETEEEWDKLTLAIATLSEADIFIDDSPSITVADIRAKCRRLKVEKGLGLIVIDYLQLISGRGKSGENRQQEVSEISRTLKAIARELEVPVIALSQLSRSVEQRQDKRPMMSDLRESGSIEQDADIVAFLYRDDYYDQESEKKNSIEIIIAKQRNGPVGTVELGFQKQYNKFVNMNFNYS
jgi:replicative DNA helicase